MVVRTLNANTRLAQATLAALVQSLPAERGCACGEALHDALITSRLHVAPEVRRKLSLLVERYLA
jgi:hypothetical protein